MAHSDATIREILAEAAAQLYKMTESELLEGGRMLRYWPEINQEVLGDAITYVKTYASAKNTTAGDTVATPMVNGKAIPGTWIMLNVQEFRDERGNLNFYQELVRPEDHTWTNAKQSAARSTRETVHTQGAEIATFTASSGTIRKVVQRKTEPGKFETQDEIETPTDQTASEWDKTAAETVVRAKHTEGPALTDPTPAAGQIVRALQDPTEAGNARTVTETRTAIDQTQTMAEVRADETSLVTVHTARAIADVPSTPPVPSTGEIKTLKIEPTEFKERSKTVEETRTAIDQTIDPSAGHSMAEDAGDETIVAVEHSAAEAAEADVAVAEGVVTRVENKAIAYKDKFQTRKTTTIGKRQVWSLSWLTSKGTAFFKWVHNATALEQSADTDLTGLTAATNNSVSGKLNQLGLIDYTISKNPVPAGGTDTWPEWVGTDSIYFNTREYRRIFDPATGNWLEQMRVWKWLKEVHQFGTQHSAAEWVDDVVNELSGWGVDRLGSYKYIGTRITQAAVGHDTGWVTQ